MRFDCSLAKQTTSFADMSQTLQCGDLFSAYQISESCWYDGVCMFCQNSDVHAVCDQSRDRDLALWGSRCRIETTCSANLAHRWQTVFAGQSPPFCLLIMNRLVLRGVGPAAAHLSSLTGDEFEGDRLNAN